MNTLSSPWLPWLTRQGEVVYHSPSVLADPDIVDLSLPRADFQGAAYQFLIGLLQTLFPPANHGEWLDRYLSPPSQAELCDAFGPFEAAFELVGDGSCFMQDLDPLEDAKPSTVAGLLIDSPGANGIKLNIDHFIKRGRVDVVCLDCAALALFTLQINAPAGGAGYRVGLRGGGPLTTLVLPDEPEASLWKRLWLNVAPPKAVSQKDAAWREPRVDDADLFPWMGATRVSDKKGVSVQPTAVHPLHAYWSMPRRLRLIVEEGACPCDLCGRESERVVRQVRAKNYGANYDGPWLHPLTPYRTDPKKPNEPPLSTKGQPGGLGYRHWSHLVLRDDENGSLPAPVVADYLSGKLLAASEARDWGDEVPDFLRKVRLWAFGYDLDKAKPRGWYATEMPLVAVPPEQQERLRLWVQRFTELARQVAWTVREQVKQAWFKSPKEARGDMSDIEIQFYEATQRAFFRALSDMGEALRQEPESPKASSECYEAWYRALRQQALKLFEDRSMSGPLEGMKAQQLERIARARRHLLSYLAGSGKGGKSVREFAEEGGFSLASRIPRQVSG